ncbi:hypothetical protein [Taklimakanibacter deserti]|uniref:hypothetical protein n=1 Tax=Taklimakanibacter deserti TaxID=2267839 RepID=UPI000E64E240
MTKHLLDKEASAASQTVKAKVTRFVPGFGNAETVAVKAAHSAHKRKPPRPRFVTIDRFRAKKLGVLVTVELDRDTEDFAHLIGKKIVIDGKMEVCFSVERLPHAPPVKKGERVSLLIKKG